MAAKCYSSIKGVAMRATRLDSLGKWATGTTASVVSSGFVSVSLTANVEDGQEFLVKNANGDLCVNEKDSPRLKYFDLEMKFCSVDPELFELMTGHTLLTDQGTTSVGYEVGETMNAAPCALEVWTKLATVQGNHQWVYWLVPMVINGIAGDYMIENGPMDFTVKANSSSNANWGKGPYNVVATNAGLTAGKLLTNIGSTTHLLHRLTEIAPPTASCGYVSQLVGWTAPV